MKKIIAITSFVSLLGASGLQAQTIDIYMTGSSAFQKFAYTAVTNLFGSSYNPANEKNSSGTGNAGGSIWAISGQMSSVFGSSQVEVHANWNGSVQGIYGLQQGTGFPSTFTNVAGTSISHSPTICFSDVDSISTAYPLDGSKFKEYHVAVQPFVWARSLGAPASITNVTMQLLAAVSQNSKANLGMFTGNTNDNGTNAWNYLYLANRNTDSGTRVTAFADIAQAGPDTIYYYSNTITPQQWYPSTFNQGNALFGPGYSGGGGLATALAASGSNNIAIGYIGVGNGNAVNSGKNILNYNGAKFSSDYDPTVGYGSAPAFIYDNVINGAYSFWAYECLDCPISSLPTDQTTISLAQVRTFSRALAGYNSSDVFVGGIGSIDNEITNNPIKLAVSLNAMHVKRTSVGGPMSKNP